MRTAVCLCVCECVRRVQSQRPAGMNAFCTGEEVLLSRARVLSRTPSLALSLILSLWPALSLSLSLSLVLPLSLFFTLSLSHSLSHSLALALSPELHVCTVCERGLLMA